jgi:hypothetical protein
MAWYDELPFIGPILGAGEQKQGDITASQQAAALGAKLRAQDMAGLTRAENYFAPAQQTITAAYGSPGAMTGGPSQYPVAPARGK